MQNPDPRLYREAEVALQFADEGSYRGFLSRGWIAGSLRRLLGGGEWDFRRPYLGRTEAERFQRDLVEMGVDARWEGEVLVITDPEGRWRPVRIQPNRHGLYQVGTFGRAVRPGSGFARDWEEVVPLPRDGPLNAEAIAGALDTQRTLGPAFRRIEEEVDVPVLIEALSMVRTDYARERLSVLLAHHRAIVTAIPALPVLMRFLDAEDNELRRSAAYSIATIAGRVGGVRVKGVEPELPRVLRERLAREQDDSVREELGAALGAFGEPPPEPRKEHADRFTQEVRRFLDFLKTEHGFEEPAVEDRWFSTTVTYRNNTTAVIASADWRDSVVEVFLVAPGGGDSPTAQRCDQLALAVAGLASGRWRETGRSWPIPATASRPVECWSARPRPSGRCEDALRGDFVRLHRAVARLAEEP